MAMTNQEYATLRKESEFPYNYYLAMGGTPMSTDEFNKSFTSWLKVSEFPHSQAPSSTIPGKFAKDGFNRVVNFLDRKYNFKK